MKFQKKLEFQKKIHVKFQIVREKLEFVGFSLNNPVPIDFQINFEKLLRSKKTSYQISKNHMQ